MEQILIGKKLAYPSGAKGTDWTTIPEGAIACIDLLTNKVITGKPTCNFAIVRGEGENMKPFAISEVDINSLDAVKAEYSEGTAFSCDITIPSAVIGKTYTIVIALTGMEFERYKWSAVEIAKTTAVADIAKKLATAINANKDGHGLKATASAGKITLTGTEIGKNYMIYGADELMGVEPANVVRGKKTILDKAYIEDMAARCAGGKGFLYTSREVGNIYKGYPEPVEDTKYTMFTLRFAVPRVAGKTRDEVVSQVVHICLPNGSGAISTLDTIFGTGSASSGGTGAGS